MDSFGLGHFSRTGGTCRTPKGGIFCMEKPRFLGFHDLIWLTCAYFSNGLVKNHQLFFRSVKKNSRLIKRVVFNIEMSITLQLGVFDAFEFQRSNNHNRTNSKTMTVVFYNVSLFHLLYGKNHRNPLTQKGHPIVRLGLECTTRSLTGCSGWYKWV